MKIKFRGPPQARQKSRFGADKSNKNIRNPTPNYTYFDRKMGKFGEIDSADTCAGKFSSSVDGGLSRGSRVRGHGSEDPH